MSFTPTLLIMKIYLPFKIIPAWFPYDFIYKCTGLITYGNIGGYAFLSKKDYL